MISTYQLLEFAAQSWPDSPAIIDKGGAVSYSELYAQTEVLKAELLRLGLLKGQGLGVMARNGSAFVAMMFAGMGCGAVVLPISHQLKAAEIDALMNDTQLHAVLDDQSGVQPVDTDVEMITYAQQTLRFASLERLENKPLTPLNDAAFIRYTSGTTGRSKGVVLTHQSILQRVAVTQKALNLIADDAVLWVLPMAFHFLVTILVYIRAGTRIIVCKDLLAHTIIQDANQHHATMLYAAPMHFRLLAADLSAEQMPTLQSAISTSAAIPLNIAEKFAKRFNLPVTQAYGIIELGLPLLDSTPDNAKNPQSVGFPISEFSIELLNADNEPVAEKEVGRLAIRGPGMFDAYLKPWQTREQVMDNGWFMTGDLAQREADGRIVVCGREKTMINVSGNKAFPEEIEAVLNKHTAIVAAHVYGQQHPLMGEIVCAEVVLVENAELDVEAILRFCRAQLSAYKIPQRLKQVAQIAHTQSGKIIRVKASQVSMNA
ncbi:MAG: long-chain acyl-CoA synthetase [Methyloprofundus sp.]|nr:MAG: long-chain acyl-CoA synthetase [Methyloprofundus sp.]